MANPTLQNFDSLRMAVGTEWARIRRLQIVRPNSDPVFTGTNNNLSNPRMLRTERALISLADMYDMEADEIRREAGNEEVALTNNPFRGESMYTRIPFFTRLTDAIYEAQNQGRFR